MNICYIVLCCLLPCSLFVFNCDFFFMLLLHSLKCLLFLLFLFWSLCCSHVGAELCPLGQWNFSIASWLILIGPMCTWGLNYEPWCPQLNYNILLRRTWCDKWQVALLGGQVSKFWLMQVVPPGDKRDCFKWRQVVARPNFQLIYISYTSGATWWLKLELMSVVLVAKSSTNKVTSFKDSIAWVRCASANVLIHFSLIYTLFLPF